MRLVRMLVLAAAFAAPTFVAAPANAGPCVMVFDAPLNAFVLVCANHNGCLLYEVSGSDKHMQLPLCVG